MENKADKLIESIEYSRRAMPSAKFMKKIEDLALRYTTVADKVSLSTIMAIAATFLLLLTVNVMIMSKSNISSIGQSSYDIASSSIDLIPTKSLYYE